MGNIFNMDNKFFTFMGRVADLIILNLLCILFCIPVVTAGASITAMFYVTLKMVRNEESYIVRSFWKSFRQNFKQATIINLIFLAVAGLIYADFSIIKVQGPTINNIMKIALCAVTFLILLVYLYTYPVLAKFYNNIRNTLRNAFFMAIRHLPYTLVMLVISASPFLLFNALSSSARAQSYVLMVAILVGPALIAYCNSFFFVKIFDQYIPGEPEDSAENTTEAEHEPLE